MEILCLVNGGFITVDILLQDIIPARVLQTDFAKKVLLYFTISTREIFRGAFSSCDPIAS